MGSIAIYWKLLYSNLGVMYSSEMRWPQNVASNIFLNQFSIAFFKKSTTLKGNHQNIGVVVTAYLILPDTRPLHI